MKMLKNLTVLLFSCFLTVGYGQNLLPDFVVGTGSQTPASPNTPSYNIITGNNERLMGTNPHGDQDVLWKGIDDSGFFSIPSMSSNQAYRYSVWVKRPGNSQYSSGNIRFYPFKNATQNLDGSSQNAYYFFLGDLPSPDEWYLIVGYLYESSYPTPAGYPNNYEPESGVYDLLGNKVTAGTVNDFKMLSGTSNNRFLIKQHGVSNVTESFIWEPRIDVINGTEPSIQELVFNGSPPVDCGDATGAWSTNEDVIYFNCGSVAINTNEVPDNYSLAVDGKAIFEEVKVNDSGNWPDFVFENDYELLALTELKNYIDLNGHLPNVPSAAIVKYEGIEIGKMNKILLQKIEELTLYLIKQDKEIKDLKDKLESIEKE